MSKELRIVYLLSFITGFPLAVFDIFSMPDTGGPCNGGIAIMISFFGLATCFLLLVVPFIKTIRSKYSQVSKPLSVAALALWTFEMFTLANDQDALRTIFFLCFFEFFILLTLFFSGELSLAD